EFATSYFSKNAITPIESIVPIAFPNPTNCGIQINYSFEGSLQLHIYNSLGQLVQTQESDFSSSRVAVNLDKLSSGVYYIIGKTASSGEKHFQEKVVKM
ncbi:MAG: T9SS type A sorting domain-containing protein, partial [Chitinophagales bacterium]